MNDITRGFERLYKIIEESKKMTPDEREKKAQKDAEYLMKIDIRQSAVALGIFDE